MKGPWPCSQLIALPVQSGAAGCIKGFVKCFLEVPLACLGSMTAAVQHNSLYNSQKTFHKTFFTNKIYLPFFSNCPFTLKKKRWCEWCRPLPVGHPQRCVRRPKEGRVQRRQSQSVRDQRGEAQVGGVREGSGRQLPQSSKGQRLRRSDCHRCSNR